MNIFTIKLEEIRFLKGRLKFGGEQKGSGSGSFSKYGSSF